MEALEDLLRRAEELVDRGDYGAVVALLEPVQEAGNPEVLYTLGLACCRLEKYQEAINHLNQSLSLKPDYILALARRGLAYQDLGQNPEATADFEQALTIDPQDHHDWRGRGIALDELKQYKEAIVSYNRALDIKPDDHVAWNNRGIILCDKLKLYKKALDDFNKSLEIKPDYHTAWSNRGVALGKLGIHKDAIASFDKALELKPEFDHAWYSRGVALEKLSRHKDAITSYEKALELKPDYRRAWDAWRIYNANGRLSFQDWFRAQQICEAGLKRITFEADPIRHLTIWKYYLWVCSRTRTPEQVKAIVEEASERFLRYLAQAQLQEIEAERFRKEFVRFDQIQVSNLAQMGELEQALEMAEKQRNFRLGWLINGQSYQQTNAPSYQQAQQLLKPDTAIIYWHYSLVGLTTFILKHGQPLKILLPPPAPPSRNSMGIQGDIAILKQVQDLEKWLEDWKNDYTAYGKNQAPDPDHAWRSQMKLRLDNPNKGSGSLKLILNIRKLIDEHLQGIDHLILIPHRDLHLLPLHTLFPFGYTTTYLPSLQSGLNLQSLPQPATKPLLNLHQPTDSPYIELTKNIIDILCGAETQKIPNLNKAQFLQLLQENHQALQFTGHGCHDPETPENSYLNLGEDKLLLTDILRHQQLDLSSYRLICLTACESGITTKSLLDEYIGWGSAFLAKQARAVISTLWNVDVRSSVFLMIRFYQLFSKPEKPVSASQALREAQSWLSMLDYEGLAKWYTELAKIKNLSPQYRDYLHTEAAKLQADPEKINSMERPFTNPYHWAGFICTGLNQ